MIMEVEVKALIEDQDMVPEIRRKISDLGGKYVDSQTQKNFYYHRPDKDSLLKLSQRFQQVNEISDVLEKAQSISLRLRKIDDNECLLVAKIALDEDGAANGVSRIEVEKNLEFESIEELDEIFQDLGLSVQSKWSRKRDTYKLRGATVTIDYNAGYGYVCEVEKVVSADLDQEKIENELRTILHDLGLEEIDGERLNRMFHHYNQNWEDYYGSERVFRIG